MRILGLDFGDKTIGVAVSDPFGWTAQGVEIIRRDNPMEFKKCMRRLAELVEEYSAEVIVLGYPKNLDGSEGDRCVKTNDFCERIKKRFPKVIREKVSSIRWQLCISCRDIWTVKQNNFDSKEIFSWLIFLKK